MSKECTFPKCGCDPVAPCPFSPEGQNIAFRAMLDRADDLLRRADVIADGWQAARDWCNDYLEMKEPKS